MRQFPCYIYKPWNQKYISMFSTPITFLECFNDIKQGCGMLHSLELPRAPCLICVKNMKCTSFPNFVLFTLLAKTNALATYNAHLSVLYIHVDIASNSFLNFHLILSCAFAVFDMTILGGW